MSDSLKIYHNPRCSKCRQTMQLIDDKGFSAETVEYLKHPPGPEELTRILDLLGLEPRQLMRQNEAAYEENGLDDESLSREALIDAMIEYPILMQRPIVVRGQQAIIGRPPENVLELL